MTCEDLKGVIKTKLSDDITSGDFAVGYVQGTTVVRIYTSEDLEELCMVTVEAATQKHSSMVQWTYCTCWPQAQAQ